MPYNGSGTYSLPGPALANGATVSSTEHNQFRNDVATALSTCVTKDGQQTISANLPMNNKKLTGLAAGTTAGDSVRFEQIPTPSTLGLVIGTDVQAYNANLTTLAAGGSSARSFLGVAIGTNVQAWDADLDTWATKTSPSGNVVGTSDSQTLTNKTLTSPTLTSPTIDSAPFATVSGTAPIYGCRAWVNFNASSGTPSIRASGNVSSITDNGVGDFTVNFTSALPDANYSVLGTTLEVSTGTNAVVKVATTGSMTSAPTTMTSSAVQIFVGGGTSVDANYIGVAVLR